MKFEIIEIDIQSARVLGEEIDKIAPGSGFSFSG